MGPNPAFNDPLTSYVFSGRVRWRRAQLTRRGVHNGRPSTKQYLHATRQGTSQIQYFSLLPSSCKTPLGVSIAYQFILVERDNRALFGAAQWSPSRRWRCS